ncbi:MAG: beta-CASP ribonuclease aCPSF1 [Promethearchaeota archaeon]
MLKQSLEELKNQLRRQLPPEAKVSEIEFEGPFLVVYAARPDVLMEDGQTIKNLAKTLRKRIVIRSDPSVRMDKESAEIEIKNIVPEEAGISSCSFDDTLGEVVIESKKPGLVIGQNGATLREITKRVFWRPTVLRTPPIESNLIANIRHILQKESSERKRILVNIGRRIHRYSISMAETGWIRVTGLGGCGEVGRSCILIETKESRILVDCGVNVGRTEPYAMFPQFNAPEFDIGQLDAVVITHAHLDHSGFLPFLFKYGYRGPVYCNEATRSLMTLLQNDYLQIAQNEGKLLPFNSNDIRTAILHTIPRRYGEVTDLSPDVRLTLSPAGHILGSSIVHFHMGDGQFNLAVAHDFKFARSRLLSPANVNFPRLEALIMESTYGGTKDIMPSRKEAERQLIRIINQTVRGGGKVLIPTLAVGRAQELLVVMDKYIRNGELEETPIYLDGMISEATAIHTCHPEYLSQELQNRIFNTGQNPFLSEYFVQVENSKHREEIEEGSPSVILATSGMLTGGPSVEYFQHLAGSEKHSIVFVSYQAEKTLGKRIQSGAKEIRMFRQGKMDLIRVNMDVHTVQGFSGHADRRELMNYIQKLSPKPMKILCVHGQRNKSESLASSIEKRFHIETQVPQNLESIRFI